MAFAKIMVYGNGILRQRAREVEDFDGALADTIDKMYATMYKSHGIGLAAPQVGLSQRIVVVDVSDYDGPKMALINPKILSKSQSKEWEEEGCLSIPGIRAQVERSTKIRVRTQDPEGKTSEFTARGLFARVIQHELDHLDGILFTDHVSQLDAENKQRLFELQKVSEMAVA
jgi:peptide deformylase